MNGTIVSFVSATVIGGKEVHVGEQNKYVIKFIYIRSRFVKRTIVLFLVIFQCLIDSLANSFLYLGFEVHSPINKLKLTNLMTNKENCVSASVEPSDLL